MYIPRVKSCDGGVGLVYNKCYKIEKNDVTSFESVNSTLLNIYSL